LRFYAGSPLRTQDGYNLGTLCVIDKQPRELTSQQTHVLDDLAALVVDELELRLAAREQARRAAPILAPTCVRRRDAASARSVAGVHDPVFDILEP
jgi:GAF domain-containing protein